MVATLAAMPTTRADASVMACFSALAPLGEAEKAAAIAAQAGACSSEATGDPVMAMTIAALTAAAVGGAFSTPDQCNALINGTVGKLVAAALLQLPLPNDAKKLLADYANGTTQLSFDEIVAAFPALSAVPAYIHCGCAVAGAPGAFAKIADDYAHTVSSCANFASDAVNTFLNGAESVGLAIHHALNGPSLTPGIQQEQTCYPPEILPDGVRTAATIWTDPGFACSVIRCAPGHVVVQTKDRSGKTLSECAAKCPNPVPQPFQSGSLCYSETDWNVVNGVCTQVPGTTTCCGTGQKLIAWGSCSPACAGTQYWDMKVGRCRSCAPGWFPVHESESTSVGSCSECPAGKTFNYASRRCEPLNCGPSGSIDAKNTHICDCGPQAVRRLDGTCQPCGAGFIIRNGMCLLAPKTGRVLSPALHCPSGTRPNSSGTACLSIQPPRVFVAPNVLRPRPTTPPRLNGKPLILPHRLLIPRQ